MVQVPGTTLELGVEHEYYDVHWNLAENDEEGVEQNALFQLRQTQRRGKIPQLQLMIDEVRLHEGGKVNGKENAHRTFCR